MEEEEIGEEDWMEEEQKQMSKGGGGAKKTNGWMGDDYTPSPLCWHAQKLADFPVWLSEGGKSAAKNGNKRNWEETKKRWEGN
jgi:hypothetical protein